MNLNCLEALGPVCAEFVLGGVQFQDSVHGFHRRTTYVENSVEKNANSMSLRGPDALEELFLGAPPCRRGSLLVKLA